MSLNPLLRGRFRLKTGPSALRVLMTWDAAMEVANYLALVTGQRMAVRRHPLPTLGWVVDVAPTRLKVVNGA